MKILLIDDDELEFEILETSITQLHQQDITCVYCENPDKALAELRVALDVPDYIFLDIKLGAYSCNEFIASMKALPRLSDIPIVMYSNEDIGLRKGFWVNSGADYFFSKTYLAELMLVLKYLTKNHLSPGELGLANKLFLNLR